MEGSYIVKPGDIEVVELSQVSIFIFPDGEMRADDQGKQWSDLIFEWGPAFQRVIVRLDIVLLVVSVPSIRAVCPI